MKKLLLVAALFGMQNIAEAMTTEIAQNIAKNMNIHQIKAIGCAGLREAAEKALDKEAACQEKYPKDWYTKCEKEAKAQQETFNKWNDCTGA